MGVLNGKDDPRMHELGVLTGIQTNFYRMVPMGKENCFTTLMGSSYDSYLVVFAELRGHARFILATHRKYFALPGQQDEIRFCVRLGAT